MLNSSLPQNGSRPVATWCCRTPNPRRGMACRWLWSLSLLVIVATAGCGQKPGSKTEEVSDSGATPDGSATPGKKKIIPIRREERTLEGNWVMIVTKPGDDNLLHDNYLWIVQVSKDGAGKYQAEITDASNDKLNPKIEATVVDGKNVQLQIKNDNKTFDFQGVFDGVSVRGTFAHGLQEMYLGRMLTTDETKLAPYTESALPPAADQFSSAISAMKDKPQPAVILKLAKDNRMSPVSLNYTFYLLGMTSRGGADDATLQTIIDLCVDLASVWGKRMELEAHMTIAQQLVTTTRLPGVALKHLELAEKLLGSESEVLTPRIAAYREQAEIQQSLTKSHSKVDEERAAAFTELQEALKKQPYNPEIMQALGDYSISTRQRTAAIDYYSGIVALPLLEAFVMARRAGQPAGDPTPTEVLTKLWTEEHGNPDELRAHLIKVNRERLAAFREEIRKLRPEVVAEDAGNHTVLLEFFTGGQAPPAVATEIAVEALRETYPATKVIALRYHQHIPGPDGLVNMDGEERFAFYELNRTPFLAVDGALMNPDQVPYGGYLQNAPTSYAILRAVIDPRLKKTTPVQLKLAAKIENGELDLQAEVAGATEDELPTLRLRLALVEEVVESPMPNGIRQHPMVVREMPGGARGIGPKKGELKFSFTMPASDVQKRLTEYLTRYESGTRIQIPPEVKPAVQGQLFLVAWVQNDKLDPAHPEIGRGIIQTAMVPVIGSGNPVTTPNEKTEPATPGKPATPVKPETPTQEAKPKAAESLIPPAPSLPE